MNVDRYMRRVRHRIKLTLNDFHGIYILKESMLECVQDHCNLRLSDMPGTPTVRLVWRDLMKGFQVKELTLQQPEQVKGE